MSRARKLIRFGLPLLVVYGVFAYPIVVIGFRTDPFGDYLYAVPQAAVVPSIALKVLGRLLTFVTALTMRGVHDSATHTSRLEIRGVFRWSRNPGLVGMDILLLGFWIVMPSGLFLFGMFFYVLHMHAKVKIEEDYLAHRFGQAYLDYAGKTPRYLF